ncbi:MAG: ABC transporter permease [Gammaproteobacteria bacterium]|nr:ABC transporter permease [Gammaproteobacteria bacterium]
MTAFGYLFGKELRGVFLQPIAWVLLAVFLLVMGYTFATGLALTKTAALSRVVFQAATLLLLLIPLVTMRLLAEERRHGTLEMLLATPVREPQIVLAKFAASMTLVVAMLAPTVVYPLVLAFFGQPEWGPIYSGYVGLLLLASLLSAMGLALSALTSNQVVAATLALGLSLLLWMIDTLSAVLPAPWDELFLHVSLLARFTPFATGAMYLSDAGFFISGTLFALFCAVRALARD